MVSRHPSDLIVSVHPLANTPVLQALGKHRPPYITVVTDLVSTHALWYDRRTDLCLVPTETARQRALENRLQARAGQSGRAAGSRPLLPAARRQAPAAPGAGLAAGPAHDPAGGRRGRHGTFEEDRPPHRRS